MKAIFLTSYGDASRAFEIRETDQPKPKLDQVLIEVECFGLNYAEVMARRGLYPEAPKPPFIPGYDCVGKIVEVGPDGNQGLIGKRVMALVKFGSYAEYCVAENNMISELPENMSSSEGTALGVQYLTAYFMAKIQVNLFIGEKVLIRAASGGVGTALAQICRNEGLEIHSLTGSDQKKKALLERGDHVVYNYNDSSDLEKFNSDGTRFDCIFNPVAGKTFKTDLKKLNNGGKLVLFGASSRNEAKKGFFHDLKLLWQMGLMFPIFLLGKSTSVHGVNILRIAEGKPALIHQCLKDLSRLYSNGVIKPVIDSEHKAIDVAIAHEKLESGKSQGKIVLYW